MALLKYQMKCKSEDCAKSYFVVVPAEETDAPNICPFCGSESAENSGEDSEAS